MTSTARSIEDQVFQLERVRIALCCHEQTQFETSYLDKFSAPLSDADIVGKLAHRLQEVIGAIQFTIVNPVVAGRRVSFAQNLGTLRNYFAPPPVQRPVEPQRKSFFRLARAR